MEIHKRIYEAIPSTWAHLFEDIGRGIYYGDTRPVEARLAALHLETISNLRKQLTSIHLEYDMKLEIDLESDLRILEVSVEELAVILASPLTSDKERAKAEIFRGAAYGVLKDIRNWAEKYK